MSITGQVRLSDSDYGVRALFSIESVDSALFGEKGNHADITPDIVYFCSVLSDSMEDIPSRLDHTELINNPLLHRMPIWEVIDSVLQEDTNAIFYMCDGRKERAKVLRDTLILAEKYTKLCKVIATFVRESEKLGLYVDIGGTSQPITIILHPEITGKEAYFFAQSIVPKIEKELTTFVGLQQALR